MSTKPVRQFPWIFILVVVLGSVGAIALVSMITKPGPVEFVDRATGPTHIHTTLNVFGDGVRQVVPGNIGGGHGALHTHDTSGVLHVESPIGGTSTLAHLLRQWGVGSDKDKLCTAVLSKPSCAIDVENQNGVALTLDTVLLDGDVLTLRLTSLG